MAFFWCILIDLVLLWFFCGNWLLDYLLPRKLQLRRQLRMAAKNLRHRLRRDGDLLTQAQFQELSDYREKLLEARASGTPEAQEKLLKHYSTSLSMPFFPHHGRIGTNLEVLVVSIGVAFAIRSLFIGPFRIPTGSMQPTLFGIHYVALADEEIPRSRLAAVFDRLNHSRRYFRLVAPANGMALFKGIASEPSKPLNPWSTLPYYDLAGQLTAKLLVPATADNAAKLLYDVYQRRAKEKNSESTALHFQKGETIAQGAMESGDSLFVNRLSLCFGDPVRGDIMVFSTRDLTYNDKPLAGDFYVKRLVGLPGDTLKIVDRTLYVRPQGEAEFFPLDGTVSKAFGRIHSMQNGYAGHSVQPSGTYLKQDGEEYTVPEEMFFLMGDNTDNSLDCRFFGPISRQRLLGSPCLVWWPFSERFGVSFDKR